MAPGDNEGDGKEKKPLPRGLLGRKGTPLASGTRLPSIKGPRDLTLGGVKKKTFVPNIHARKDKSKESGDAKVKIESQTSKKSTRGSRSDRGRGRGRGRGKNKPELIQTQGSVFGEGPADRVIKRGSWGSSSYEGNDTIPRPKLSLAKSDAHKICKAEDETTLKELLRDDFIDNPDSDSGEDVPNQLPLISSLKLKQEDKIKSDAEATDDLYKSVEAKVQSLHSDEKIKKKDELEKPLTKLFNEPNETTTNQLLFMKLPDSLPAFIPSDSTSEKANLQQQSSSSSATKPSEKDDPAEESCTLAQLPEGYIGKLQIMQSGKIRLKLGDVCLDIENGTQVGFLQDVISINVPEGGASGNMTLLGQVNERLICVPDMSSLVS